MTLPSSAERGNDTPTLHRVSAAIKSMIADEVQQGRIFYVRAGAVICVFWPKQHLRPLGVRHDIVRCDLLGPPFRPARSDLPLHIGGERFRHRPGGAAGET